MKLCVYNNLTNTYIDKFNGYKDFIIKEFYTYKDVKT